MWPYGEGACVEGMAGCPRCNKCAGAYGALGLIARAIDSETSGPTQGRS